MAHLMNRKLAILGAVGAACTLPAMARAQYVINQSGATLLENFLKAPAASNDYFDVDGDGVARIFGTNDQLAPSSACPPPARALGANQSWWVICYRATGSVNGFQENVDFGGPGFITTADNVDLFSTAASKAFYNRLQYISSGVSSNAIFNAGNPGGYPIREDTTTLEAKYAAPPTGASGGIRMDMAPVDVPSLWAVQNTGGSAAFSRLPGQGGYGTNPRRSVNTSGGTAGADGANTLAALGPRNLFDPNNPGAADSNTIFDTPIAFAPIGYLTNLGTGMSQIKQSELRHLFATGRLTTGENLVAVTRDSGSGTRNGAMNSLCLDPSFGIGDNVGPYGALAPTNLLGDDWTPNHKLGSGEMEGCVQNHRLAIGYTGAERGVNSGWLTGGRMEVLAVQFDLIGGTEYSRPNIDEILDNNANGYSAGGPAIFAHIGDPKAAPASKGGTSNGRPAMANVEAAAYLNNVTLSIAAFSAAPGGSASLFTPGEYLADNYTLVAANDYIQNPLNPCDLVANPNFNQTLQDFTRTDSTLKNPAYYTFGSVTLNGDNPNREIGPTYNDGVAGGGNYISQGGASLGYGSDTLNRNRIAGDFNGDAVRDINDATDLVLALKQRQGGAPWIAPTGSGAIAGAPGTDACIEILGDFNGDGNFDIKDARFWADGLAMDPSCGGRLNRFRGFVAVDSVDGGNLFGTTKATGVSYNVGDSAADVAGPGGNQAPGFTPVGADGTIDEHDLDSIYKQFRQNPNVSDGELNWDNTAEAVDGDLSCDVNGDLVVNQRDICLTLEMLGTSLGDVDLDGDVDGIDAGIAAGNVGNAGGWADGDVDGDGTVTATDQDIIAGVFNICCPADFNGDGFVDGIDADTFYNLFEAGDCRADVNRDGFVDGIDSDTFANEFETPC